MKNQEEDSSPETGLDLKLINEISENEFKNSMRCKRIQASSSKKLGKPFVL